MNQPIEITESELKKLERKVFIFDTSKSDKEYFKHQLYLYLKNELHINKSLNQYCWEIIYNRNEKGKTSKYLYFNERIQKLYVDRDFLKWADIITDRMAIVLMVKELKVTE